MHQNTYNDVHMRQLNDFTTIRVHEVLSRLGERIRRARKAKKLSLVQLEKICRVHRTTLGRLELGDPGVSLGIFLSVLEALQELQEIEMILSAPETPRHKRASSIPILDTEF